MTASSNPILQLNYCFLTFFWSRQIRSLLGRVVSMAHWFAFTGHLFSWQISLSMVLSRCSLSCIVRCCAVLSHLGVSDSLRPHGLQPTRPLCPWDFLGKNTGVGCHALLQGIVSAQEYNPHLLRLLYLQKHSLLLSPLGSPNMHYRSL